jgi:hypothetical protein
MPHAHLIHSLTFYSSSTFSDWTNDLLVELNDPLNCKMKKYSPKERTKLGNELKKLGDLAKFETNMANEDRFVAENINRIMDLSMDFQNYVVDPIYQGNGDHS